MSELDQYLGQSVFLNGLNHIFSSIMELVVVVVLFPKKI